MRTLMKCSLVAAMALSHATTLQQLGLDTMIVKSTAIVRGRVQVTHAAMVGSYIYTHYNVQVLEQWKGAPAAQMDFVIPGGRLNGRQQNFAGAPALDNGQEYVLFLWTSRSGLTHIIGMSQGFFISSNGMLTRPAIADHMISATGTDVTDNGLQMTLAALRSRIQTVLGGKAQ
jgi:hypothetical protein